MQISAQQNIRPLTSAAFGLRYATVGDVDIVVIGGDLLFREGLKRLFADSPIRVCGEAETIREAGALTLETAPDVAILLDAGFDKDQAALGELRAAWPNVRTVVLARRADPSMLAAAVDAGVDGCLLTDMSPAALVQSLNLVRLGENVFPTRLAADLVKPRGAIEGPSGRPINLTGREIDILRGLLNGQSNKMIANRLGTTDATVKAQLRHLLRKIGADNRTQAALWARENRIGAEDVRAAA